MAAHVLARSLSPGDDLHVPGAEVLLVAASVEQARICFRVVRDELEPRGGYRFIDSTLRVGITHVSTNTRLRVLSSSGKTAMGILGCPLLVADEPGCYENHAGQLMHDAITTAQGKPGSALRVLLIGTLAPMAVVPGHWWHDLATGPSTPSTFTMFIQGDAEKWDRASEIRKANPLMWRFPESRRTLLDERDAARADPRKKAAFLSYRLNVPSRDHRRELLTPAELAEVFARHAPPRDGAPIVGVDLAGGRAWSAAVAMWRNGRIEVVAVTPGIPDLEAQEKRDAQPRAAYRRLVESEHLVVAHGQRVPAPAVLTDAIFARWGTPAVIVCDRFKLPELHDAVHGRCPIAPRQQRWSDSTFDIEATRRAALDGNLSVEAGSRLLLALSLADAVVESDDQGSQRMLKTKGSTGCARRDDAAIALALAAGAVARAPRQTAPTVHFL